MELEKAAISLTSKPGLRLHFYKASVGNKTPFSDFNKMRPKSIKRITV
jgi:hypothetical protein